MLEEMSCDAGVTENLPTVPELTVVATFSASVEISSSEVSCEVAFQGQTTALRR